MGKDIVDNQVALATGRDENNDRFSQRIFDDSEVGQFRYSNHKGREVRDSEALEMDIHIQWLCTGKISELPNVVVK